MYKKILLPVSLMSVTLFAGCGYHASPYSPSFQNINALKSIEGKSHSIRLGDFSDPKNTKSLMCRLAAPEKLPGNQMFVEYIKNALKNELKISNLYSPNSKIKLDAKLEKINFQSNIGNGKWFITMKFNDHHQKPYRVSSVYRFSTNFVANIACSEVAQNFVPAAQKFLLTLYNNKHFQRTLEINKSYTHK